MALGLGLVLGALGSLYTGTTSLNESNEAAVNQEYQGRLALDEALRDASIIREDGRRFMKYQSLQFIGAGVELVGSALITMEQTIKSSRTEAEAVTNRGNAQADLAFREADTTRAKGRAALFSGIFSAGSKLLPAKT